jgi:hypothetical protein
MVTDTKFDESDDEQFAPQLRQADSFDGVGVAAFRVQGEIAFADILNIVGFDIFEDVDVEKVTDKLDKEILVAKDLLKAVILSFMNCFHTYIKAEICSAH